ncbi:MAG: cytochrome b/b6 domain-containing protein [Duodenibacillus sp.]|nr:cytochrome b/b6 domain-containing protein [Duodenibacillus sp.]
MTKYIQRHSLRTRITHDVAVICCLLLTVTGLFVLVPGLNNWAGADAAYSIRWAHRIIAIPFIVIPVLSMICSPKGAAHLFGSNIFGKWDKDDVVFASRFVPYLFAPGKVHMPPQREVKGAQRMADGAMLFCCIFLALSGLVLWLHTGLLPGGEWQVTMSQGVRMTARVVHDVSFLLLIVFGLGHMYLGGGIFPPYRGTWNLMFGNGRVSEADAAYHWGYWANNEIASGRNVIVQEDGKK